MLKHYQLARERKRINVQKEMALWRTLNLMPLVNVKRLDLVLFGSNVVSKLLHHSRKHFFSK